MHHPTLEISNQYSNLEGHLEATRHLFGALIRSERFPIGSGELSIAFVDDATITQVHADFMDDPTPTDVITFPADIEMESAGEIIVSVDHAINRAKEFREPFTKELSLYLIHGWLHLAGYDDRSPGDREKMRSAEKEALALVASSGDDPAFTLKR